MILRVVLTVAEVALVVAVLAFALVKVSRLLGSISATLGRVTFGVRAVEKQLSSLGPAVADINLELAGAVAQLEQRADRGDAGGRPLP